MHFIPLLSKSQARLTQKQNNYQYLEQNTLHSYKVYYLYNAVKYARKLLQQNKQAYWSATIHLEKTKKSFISALLLLSAISFFVSYFFIFTYKNNDDGDGKQNVFIVTQK